ncbi:MAG TPA: acyl-CoA thioesterase [Desulfobacterales bacterium]
MARIRLELPETLPFHTEIPVRISDINYGNHLGNDAVLSLAHEARVRFLKQHGFSELDIDGVGLIIADAVIVYKNQAFYGDVLTVSVGVGEFNRRGCDIFYRLTDLASGREVARAKTGVVFYDYHRRKIAGVPESFRRVVGGNGL